MRRLLRIMLAAAFASWMFLLQCAGQAAATELMWGVNGHPLTSYPGISFVEQLDAVKRLGLKSYRVNISEIGHAEKLGILVKLAKERDIEILPVITPSLDLDLESAAALYDRSYKLAKALVSRFKRDIRVWELGNELENYAIITACEMRDDGSQYDCSWGPASGTGPGDYFTPRWQKSSAILKGLSDGASDADPTVRKAMGTAGWGHIGAFNRMRDDGINWDISVWHLYEGDPETALRSLAAFGKPIWVTEFNNSGGSIDGLQRQADGLKRMMELLRRYAPKYRVEAAHIYELFDEPYWGAGFESVMGLIELEQKKGGGWSLGRPKPAYDVVLNEVSGKQDLSAGADETKVDVKVAPEKEQPTTCDPNAFNKTQTNVANQIAYGYCLALGRLPDSHEQWRFALDMKQGQTPLAMVDALLKSGEFDALNLNATQSDGDVVSGLYKRLLRRDVDGQGMSDFVAQLQNGKLSRVDLALALSNSSEFRDRHPLLFAVQQVQ